MCALSLVDMAKTLGVSRQYLHAVEIGKSTVSVERASRCARYCEQRRRVARSPGALSRAVLADNHSDVALRIRRWHFDLRDLAAPGGDSALPEVPVALVWDLASRATVPRPIATVRSLAG
jgi:hypothetical protein